MKNNGIISDGRQNALDNPVNWKGFHKIEIAIRKKYKKALADAGFFRRIYLNWKMDLEIKEAKDKWTEKFAPKGALYINDKNQV